MCDTLIFWPFVPRPWRQIHGRRILEEPDRVQVKVNLTMVRFDEFGTRLGESCLMYFVFCISTCIWNDGRCFLPVWSHWCGRRGSKPSQQTWPLAKKIVISQLALKDKYPKRMGCKFLTTESFPEAQGQNGCTTQYILD